MISTDRTIKLASAKSRDGRVKRLVPGDEIIVDEMRKAGMVYKQIADHFGVSMSAVWWIADGRRPLKSGIDFKKLAQRLRAAAAKIEEQAA